MRGAGLCSLRGWESWVLFNLFRCQGFVFWRQSRRRKALLGPPHSQCGAWERVLWSSPPDALAGCLLKKLEDFWDLISFETVGVWFTSGSLDLDTIDILGWIILGRGGCPVHCRTFSSISGLYPLDASSTLPTVQPVIINCPQTLLYVSWETKSLSFEKKCPRCLIIIYLGNLTIYFLQGIFFCGSFGAWIPYFVSSLLTSPS